MAIAQYMPSRAGSPQPGLARVEEARRAAALVPVGARRAAADAGCRSSRRASDGGRLSPLFGRAAGGSPALHDSAYSPLRRGSDSASRRVALWLAGRRLRSRSASPRPRRSPLQLPLSVAAPPPSQPPAADAGSRGDRGVQHSRQQQRADATFDLRLSIPAFPCGMNSSVGSAGRMMEEVANEGSDVLGERNMKEQQSNKDDVCVERAMEQVSSHDDDLLREALLETGLFTGVVSIDPMHKKVERYKQKVSWDVFHMVTLQ
uniref:Uncharacterized protein n=1 Tax=Oryza glumipatula TaxID=40148 RepID=A0A0D9Y9S9_9ORYZ